MTTQLHELFVACLQQQLFNVAVQAACGMSATTIPSMVCVQAWWAGTL